MDPEDTKSEKYRTILAAAADVFNAEGYSTTTMDAVARRAGVSKGSIYNYFRSKDDLFRRIFSDAVEPDRQMVRQLVRQDLSPMEKIDRLLERWYSRLENYKQIGALVLEFWAAAARRNRPGRTGGTLDETYAEMKWYVAEIIQQGVRKGMFRTEISPTTAAAILMGMLNGIIVQVILDFGVEVNDELSAAVRRAVRTALAAGNPRVGTETNSQSERIEVQDDGENERQSPQR